AGRRPTPHNHHNSLEEDMSAHPFDEAIHLEPDAERAGMLWHGATHPAYWNMVGPFGGLTAAVVLQAVRGHPERIGTPISLTLTYAAPIVEGPYEVHTECVAATRSTQHWSIRCVQQGKVVVNAIALFAQRRDTWNSAEMRMPQVPAAADVAPIDTSVARVAWLRRYEVRPVQGGIDVVQKAQAHEQSITRQWVRDEPPRPLDYPALASICDVFFPRI